LGSGEGETNEEVEKSEAPGDAPALGTRAGLDSVGTPVCAPHAASTRRTLAFPKTGDRCREAHVPQHGPGTSKLFTAEKVGDTLYRAIADRDDGDDDEGDHESNISSERPSERSTVPTGLSNGVASDSSGRMIELSTSNLESDRDVSSFTTGMLAAASLRRRTLALALDLDEELDEEDEARAITDPPPADEPPSAQSIARRRTTVALLVSHGLVAVVVALVAGSGSPPAASKIPREPNVALGERIPLASPGTASLPPPPSGGCVLSGNARVLSTRAHIGPGLDVSVLETGFGVALASGRTEAVGLRIEGSGLRIAETVRVKASTNVSHAVVDPDREDESESLDVRVDSDDARTVVGGGGGPAFRIAARGGSITAFIDDLRGVRVRNIWPLPGSRVAAATPAPPTLALVKSSLPSVYEPPSFSKLPNAPRPPVTAAGVLPLPVQAGAPEVVRAAGRDDGGAVVALRRPSMFWLGVTDAALAPAGPLVALVRKGATVGTPAVSQWGGGGAVAWAERPIGEREWSIVVAAFTPDGEGGALLGPVHVVGKGMSPTLAALPDGDLVLAHSDGPAGAHRVVARRLGRGLEPRGDLIVVSPEGVNAGQPAIAVRPDGRGVVAFFAADRGRAASVFATPLACDPGL
jgi:hypothetical protein